VKLPELKVYIDALITHNMTTVIILLMGCLQLELKEVISYQSNATTGILL